jgi:lipoprotein-anchoring transpeptidase ErfK/SrfK
VSTHRREVRPRYGRIAALSAALTVSLVAALAGLGVLASGSASAGLAAGPAAYTSDASTADGTAPSTLSATPPATTPTTTGTPAADPTDEESSSPTVADPVDETAIPASSGTGRRIVFSESLQRVWLVDAHDSAERTYEVSGSVTDNLQPGTYAVYSKSRWAVGVDDTGVMQYFVRFTQGPTGASIGFHTIPTKNGEPLQTKAQLGTPQSHGCIRQATDDAIALWDFAPVDTKVVVVA